MPSKKMDPKEMSSKQKWEPARIARLYKIPVKIVRETALEIGKKGKPSRSTKKIYAALEAKGYRKVGKKEMVLPEDTSAPDMTGQGPYVNS